MYINNPRQFSTQFSLHWDQTIVFINRVCIKSVFKVLLLVCDVLDREAGSLSSTEQHSILYQQGTMIESKSVPGICGLDELHKFLEVLWNSDDDGLRGGDGLIRVAFRLHHSFYEIKPIELQR